jgi:hypothetical protein
VQLNQWTFSKVAAVKVGGLVGALLIGAAEAVKYLFGQ